MTLGVIIPTLGRPSLSRTVDSALGADRIVVIPDHDVLGAFGDPVRNLALDAGVGTSHVATIDDDDVYLPLATSLIKHEIAKQPDRWFIFQMVGGPNSHFPSKVVGDRKQLRLGEVGTPMLVFPAGVKARFLPPPDVHPALQTPGPGAFGDYGMALALREELGEPVWVEQVIALIRP